MKSTLIRAPKLTSRDLCHLRADVGDYKNHSDPPETNAEAAHPGSWYQHADVHIRIYSKCSIT